ncbi:MAG: hypothetical protein GWN07_29455, partial [Actinobacteria bacterium]|nr:hypothetical protein [Actinomycetota bacterium]NIU65095.1 hypothetical protein [Actinomycetota bacterium]NIW26899.1 hypothetical protein [Actinomycetota bacterium]NIX23726.1 hypothetical protein [Actinomycetota bacterium]
MALHRRTLLRAGLALAALPVGTAAAGGNGKNDTTTKSHFEDADGNGIPDEGETVT